MKVAACRGLGHATFFPERGQPLDEARAICAGCLVAEECRAFASADGELAGVWGGTSAKQRRQILRSVA
jgi:WhiB family redox-sensing transcriptional regulator